MNVKINRLALLLLFLLIATFSATAQKKSKQKEKVDFSGSWQGVVTQQDGYSSEYSMELYLRQEGNKIIGRSYVSVDSIYAEMEVEGVALAGKIVMVKDMKIVDDEIIDKLEWCLKTYQLILRKEEDAWHLEGSWQGKTSVRDCIPGEIYLKKAIPRA